MNQVKTPSNIMPTQPAEQQAAQGEADLVGDPVEALAVPQRQHPGDAAVVEPRLDGDEDADDQHQDDAGDRAERAADRAGQPADRAEQLRAEVARRSLAGSGRAIRRTPSAASNCAVTTIAQRLELGGDRRAGEIEDPADEAEAEQR